MKRLTFQFAGAGYVALPSSSGPPDTQGAGGLGTRPQRGGAVVFSSLFFRRWNFVVGNGSAVCRNEPDRSPPPDVCTGLETKEAAKAASFRLLRARSRCASRAIAAVAGSPTDA